MNLNVMSLLYHNITPELCQTHNILFFFFNDTATTEIYTLSLHDALPISSQGQCRTLWRATRDRNARRVRTPARSEEHTSELQPQSNLVCRLLLEKKKKTVGTVMLDS